MRYSFKRSLIFVLTIIIVTLAWIGLEYTLDGEIINQHSDSIVALIFGWLLSRDISNKLNII